MAGDSKQGAPAPRLGGAGRRPRHLLLVRAREGRQRVRVLVDRRGTPVQSAAITRILEPGRRKNVRGKDRVAMVLDPSLANLQERHPYPSCRIKFIQAACGRAVLVGRGVDTRLHQRKAVTDAREILDAGFDVEQAAEVDEMAAHRSPGGGRDHGWTSVLRLGLVAMTTLLVMVDAAGDRLVGLALSGLVLAATAPFIRPTRHHRARRPIGAPP
jgi:hypothetical protein